MVPEAPARCPRASLPPTHHIDGQDAPFPGPVASPLCRRPSEGCSLNFVGKWIPKRVINTCAYRRPGRLGAAGDIACPFALCLLLQEKEPNPRSPQRNPEKAPYRRAPCPHQPCVRDKQCFTPTIKAQVMSNYVDHELIIFKTEAITISTHRVSTAFWN